MEGKLTLVVVEAVVCSWLLGSFRSTFAGQLDQRS